LAEKASIWTRRFMWAALIQGGVMFIITGVLLALNSPWPPGMYSPARAVAGGSAGTWLEVGYVGYVLFLVLGTAMSAFFYYYIESVENRPYTGRNNLLAWGHLLLGNIAGGIGLILMMNGGYQAAAALAAGQSIGAVHTNILYPIEFPIAYLFAIGAIGPFLGGLGYFLQWRKR
jgi:hypothetical protein